MRRKLIGGDPTPQFQFYVSSDGYGVFVDTARFATFYTGNVAPLNRATQTENNEVQTSTSELYRARVQRVKTMQRRRCASGQGGGRVRIRWASHAGAVRILSCFPINLSN
ncbi:MAG: hypothetical protein QM813_17390, partial [Verrucomicrobiota bacterium]